MEIIKALIPAAGLGTRFLPFTKTIPKEMLPLMGKPALQLVVEECIASRLSDIVLVTNKAKSIIADHFDYDAGLNDLLEERNSASASLKELDRIIKQVTFTTIRQCEPLGLGHAIWLARHIMGKEYFAVCLPDDLIFNRELPGIAQLMRIAQQERGSVIAVQEVPPEMVSQYGVISIKKQISPNLFQVSQLVEKPRAKDAPSNLAIVGRYVLSHKIFSALNDMNAYAHEELHLTDAISQMIHLNERVFAYKIQGTRYDIGTPLGWLKAIVGTGLNDPQMGPALRAYLNELDTIQPAALQTKRGTENAL